MQNNQLDNNKACQNMTKLDSSAELSMEDLETVSGGVMNISHSSSRNQSPSANTNNTHRMQKQLRRMM